MSDETNTDSGPLPRKGAWLAIGAVAGGLAALGAVWFVPVSDGPGQQGDPGVLTPASQGRPLVRADPNTPPARGSSDTATSTSPEIAPTSQSEPPVSDPLAEAALQRLLERREAEETRLAERARLASDSPLTPATRALSEMVVVPKDPSPPRETADAALLPSSDPAPSGLTESGPLAPRASGATSLPDPSVRRTPDLAPVSVPAEAPVLAPAEAPVLAHVLARGAVIPTVLESAIDSDLPGLVRARVSEDVYDSVTGLHVLIPRGSALVGAYAQSAGAGQQRLFVTWTDLRLPDGTPVALETFSALGADGAAGVRGRRSTGFLKALGAAVLFDLAGNATQILTGDSQQGGETGNLGALIAAATGNATSRVAERYLGQILDGGTRFRVAAGTIMNVLVEADMTLPAQGRAR